MILLAFFITAASISGTVYDADTYEPVPFVNLFINNGASVTITDSTGKFYTKLKPGDYKIKVSHIGYTGKTIDVKLSPKQELKLSIPVNKKTFKLEEVRVLGERILEPSFRAIDLKELKKIPFAELDFFRTLQSFPGVYSVSDLVGWLYIRGGTPDENLYLMDGGEIACPQHYFGAVSAFNVNLLQDVRFSCGGFPASYGDKLSAVLDVITREGSFEKRVTKINADLLEAGIETEFPLSNNCSYIFSARKNYFKAVAPLVGIEDSTIILPAYQNFQNKLSFSLGKNNKLSLSNLLMEDAASVSGNVMGDIGGSVNWNNESNTYVLNYCTTIRDQPLRTVIYHTYLSRYANWTDYHTHNKNKLLKKSGINQNGEIKFLKDKSLEWGVSCSYLDYSLDDDWPIEFMGLERYNESINLFADTCAIQYGTYLTLNTPISSKMMLASGSRLDYNSLTDQTVMSPRLRLTYFYNPKTSLSLAWGYYQQFQALEVLTLAPELPPAKSNHYVIGIEREISKDINGKIEFYENRISNLGFISIDEGNMVVSSDASGYGFSRGIETFIKKSFTNNFFGWISCSFSKTKRTNLFDKTLADFDADQPISLNLIGVYTLGKYAISANCRHSSGRPFTPIAGWLWDDALDHWYLVKGPKNSERYPSYDRLDIKIEREFHISTTTGNIYFSILNVFQHRNVQFYNYIDSQRQPIYMLPRLAFLGVDFTIF
ncbi:MAG: TonB-dependent receptor [bacterium]|nr:TonB-dependent receptor [bacterium]